VRVLERAGAYALVRCTPVTGRQHQIRAHLAAAGHPIVGDKLYAHGDLAFMAYCDRGLTPDLAALFELPRHALHAASVTFPHPTRGTPFRVDSPLARDLAEFFARHA
jgi:23S rRNA pseudouridine1911/1915/1917 synthase